MSKIYTLILAGSAELERNRVQTLVVDIDRVKRLANLLAHSYAALKCPCFIDPSVDYIIYHSTVHSTRFLVMDGSLLNIDARG